MCDDCQAFAIFLERPDVLDRHGGTDIYQTAPARVRLTTGTEQLRCMRLSEKGMLRWYTDCCKTPVGNTIPSARAPFVGVIHSFMDHEATGRTRDDTLGPPIGYLHGRFAFGGIPARAHPKVPLGVFVRIARLLVSGLIAGRHTPSPFFDARTREPVVEPRVLSPAERDDIRRRVEGEAARSA